MPELEALAPAQFLLDGEIVIFDESGRSRFQFLQSRMGLSKGSAGHADAGPAHYLAFDILSCDGRDLRGISLAERRKVLEAVVTPTELVKCVDMVAQQGGQFYALVREQGLEGIVAKQTGSTYTSGRSPRWQKVKAIRERSFVIGGFTPPSGSRRHFGALLLGLFDNERLKYVGRVGGGFSRESLERVSAALESIGSPSCPFETVPKEVSAASWVQPKLVCDVKFNEWTRDGILRAPVFLRLREELEAHDCLQAVPVEPDEASREIALEERYDFLSNLEKPFWPEEGYTKRDLIEYYERIGPILLPYLENRPMNLERYPDGYDGKSFYQKDAPDFIPDWIKTSLISVETKEKPNRHVLCNDLATLLYLANLACIPLHPWSSRVDSIEHPDFLILDLDPGDGVSFSQVCRVALTAKEILEKIALTGYPKTSGSKGLHILVPLDGESDYASVRRFAEVIARLIVHSLEDLATIERSMEKRRGKVYLDYLQNGLGKTIVSPYSLRALPGAPVSAPLEWPELSSPIRPRSFNLKSIFRRLDHKGDLLRPLLSKKQSLRDALSRLEKVLSGGAG